jgi:hypothetical protein
VLNKLKNKALAVGLGLTIALPITAAVTGVAPVKIGAIESQQEASAAQTTWTWWGNYTYLNKSEAYNLANWFDSRGGGLARLTNSVLFTSAPYIALISGPWTFSAYSVRDNLNYCANNYGQAYFRLSYYGTNWISPVSCK